MLDVTRFEPDSEQQAVIERLRLPIMNAKETRILQSSKGNEVIVADLPLPATAREEPAWSPMQIKQGT